MIGWSSLVCYCSCLHQHLRPIHYHNILYGYIIGHSYWLFLLCCLMQCLWCPISNWANAELCQLRITKGGGNCSNRDMQECPWRWRIHLQYKHIKFACILTHLLPSQLKTTLHPLFDRLLSHVSNRSSIEDKLVSISDLDTDCFSTVTHLAVLTLLWQAISGQKSPFDSFIPH